MRAAGWGRRTATEPDRQATGAAPAATLKTVGYLARKGTPRLNWFSVLELSVNVITHVDAGNVAYCSAGAGKPLSSGDATMHVGFQ